MKNRLIALTMVLTLVFSTNAFAYSWQKVDEDWYIKSDNTGELIKDTLLDTGDNVFFFDDNGKLVTGWWKNKKSGNIYFFSNKKGESLGGMVFGMHDIDGYKHYFADDGSLVTSKVQGEYVKVSGDYYADYYGYIYLNNTLQRDTSIAKSEYYTNPAYYNSIDLNNYFLANSDTVTDLTYLRKLRDDVGNNTNTSGTNDTNTNGKKSADLHKVSGGLNYYVDDNGSVVTYGDTYETKEAEKYGPMRVYE